MIYPYASRTSLEHISSQNVFLPGGKLKPLTEIASVSIDSGDAEIERENLQTSLDNNRCHKLCFIF